MIEVINIIEFIQEAQNIMSFERLKKEIIKRYGELFLQEPDLLNVEFDDLKNNVYIFYYNPKEELQIETNIIVTCI
jgi:hypothetical protein